MFSSEILTRVTVGLIEKGPLFPENVALRLEFAFNVIWHFKRQSHKMVTLK